MDTKRRTFMKWFAAAIPTAVLIRYLQIDSGSIGIDKEVPCPDHVDSNKCFHRDILHEGRYEMKITYRKCDGKVLKEEIKKVG